MRLEEGRTFLRDLQILSGAARDGAYAVNLKANSTGNWRNVVVIDQIGIKREKIKNVLKRSCSAPGVENPPFYPSEPMVVPVE